MPLFSFFFFCSTVLISHKWWFSEDFFKLSYLSAIESGETTAFAEHTLLCSGTVNGVQEPNTQAAYGDPTYSGLSCIYVTWRSINSSENVWDFSYGNTFLKGFLYVLAHTLCFPKS